VCLCACVGVGCRQIAVRVLEGVLMGKCAKRVGSNKDLTPM